MRVSNAPEIMLAIVNNYPWAILAIIMLGTIIVPRIYVPGESKTSKVHSLSSGKGKMFLCAACHAFTPHVNAWKNRIGIVVQARG